MADNEEAVKQAEELIEQQKKKETEEITKQQVITAALGYYLPEIMLKVEKIPLEPNNNVFPISEDKNKIKKELPSYTNILTKKENSENICELSIFKSLQENALFLSQAVPYVKIYKTISKEGRKIDINLPFDIVAGQKNGDKEELQEKILQGGSGGAVGVANFSWKSEGKNEGNKSLYNVNFKIVLQDASELKKTRNIVGDNKVAILDLLYYGFLNNEKDSKKNENENKDQIVTTNEPDYMEFKAELGFNFSESYQRYSDYFKTNLNLRVYKHNFNFDQSGKVELEIVAIGNIESDFSNKVKYNILESEKVKNLVRALEFFNKLKTLKSQEAMANTIALLQRQNKVVYNIVDHMFALNSNSKKAGDAIDESQTESFIGTELSAVAIGAAGGASVAAIVTKSTLVGATIGAIPGALVGAAVGLAAGAVVWYRYMDIEGFEEIKEKIKVSCDILKQEIKKEKVNILNKIFKSLKDKGQLRYFILDYENFNLLKTFISLGEISNLDTDFINQISNLNLEGIQELKNSSESDVLQVEVDEPFLAFTPQQAIGELNISSKDPYKQIREEINKSNEKENESEIIPFVFLGDLIQAFINEDTILKSNTNIFLGPFSFYNYKKSFSTLNKELTPNAIENNQNKYLIHDIEKNIGNLYHVPISIDTLQKWFKDSIESKEEKSYSFNNFLKFCMSDLIKQNIATKTAPASPYNTVSINPYYFSVKDTNMIPLYQKIYVDKTSPTIREVAKVYSERENNNFNFENVKRNIVFLSVAEYALESNTFSGNFYQDCEKNIMHLFVNSMSSIVKNISFSRDDDARLETANLQAANDANPNKIIRQVYHANINMFGNCIFEPGNLLYIKANYPGVPLSDPTLEQIGLGGYYRIINIENKITTSGFSTSLKCIWEMSSDGSVNVYNKNQQGIKVTLVNEND